MFNKQRPARCRKCGEVGSLQGCAADEAAVHILLAQQLLAVLGVHAAAVLDRGSLGHSLAVDLADDLADLSADLLGLLGGGGLAGADGPDRLIGDDDICHLLGGDITQGDLGLHPDQLFGDALLTLLQALAHADDDLQAGVQSGQSALVDGLVGLLEVDVFSANMDVGALGLCHSRDQIGVGSADDDLAGCVLDGGDQLVHQNSSLGGGLVHLPVASNDSLALCLIHDMFSLPSY